MNCKSYVATIEARMNSRRLPGKVLLPAGGKPMLQHLVERLKQVQSLSDIILATTENPTDDILEDFAKEVGIKCFRGSEEDVLSRVIGAAEQCNADVIVEISGDCPLIDPELISQCIEIHKHNHVDFVSNAAISSYPAGMDVSIFSVEVLKRSESMSTNSLHREHVCLNIVQNPDDFSHLYVIAPPKLHSPDIELVLDEQSDYELICHLIDELGQDDPFFSCDVILDYLQSHADVRQINANVIRKGAT